jgi:Rv2632c-like
MNMDQGWSVTLSVSELDDETQAEASLVMPDGSQLSGHGRARRNPADQNITKIGEEIAVARSLSDLAHRLLHAATADVERVTHERARLHM